MTATKKGVYQIPPKEGFVLTHFLTVADVKRSADFYHRIFGGKIIRQGEPTIIEIANSWVIFNVGGAQRTINQALLYELPIIGMKLAAL